MDVKQLCGRRSSAVQTQYTALVLIVDKEACAVEMATEIENSSQQSVSLQSQHQVIRIRPYRAGWKALWGTDFVSQSSSNFLHS